jgi:hypothetical protein
MKPLNPPAAVLQRRLYIRGFRSLTPDQAVSIETWMRLNPALNALLFALCGVTGSVPGLVVLAVFFLIGMLTAVHPFELFYTEIIRSLEQTPALPPSPPLRRVVFGIGAAGSLASAWGFSSGHHGLGYVLTAIMVSSTAFLAFTHICIPSTIFRILKLGVLRFRRKQRSQGVSETTA